MDIESSDETGSFLPGSLPPTALVPGSARDWGQRWALVIGPRSLNASMLAAIARMGEAGPVRVLDGGNRFNAYAVARAARGQPQVLDRITVSRAFTCYQVLSLLESTPAIQVTSPAVGGSPSPLRLVALDLLSTFYDESVQTGERKRLLRACLLQLERLAGNGSSAISIHPPAVPGPVAVELLRLLQACPAVETVYVHPQAQPPAALRLF